MGMTGSDADMNFENGLQLLNTLHVSAGSEGHVVSLLALGNSPPGNQRARGILIPSLENSGVLQSLDFLVAPATGDKEELEFSLRTLKGANPNLKIILADSRDHPSLLANFCHEEDVRIIPVSSQEAQIGKQLVEEQLGLLVGPPGGRSAFGAHVLAHQLEADIKIGMLLTNLQSST